MLRGRLHYRLGPRPGGPPRRHRAPDRGILWGCVRGAHTGGARGRGQGAPSLARRPPRGRALFAQALRAQAHPLPPPQAAGTQSRPWPRRARWAPSPSPRGATRRTATRSWRRCSRRAQEARGGGLCAWVRASRWPTGPDSTYTPTSLHAPHKMPAARGPRVGHFSCRLDQAGGQQPEGHRRAPGHLGRPQGKEGGLCMCALLLTAPRPARAAAVCAHFARPPRAAPTSHALTPHPTPTPAGAVRQRPPGAVHAAQPERIPGAAGRQGEVWVRRGALRPERDAGRGHRRRVFRRAERLRVCLGWAGLFGVGGGVR